MYIYIYLYHQLSEISADSRLLPNLSIQLLPFISCNWLFLWAYTFYEWGFVSTYKWYLGQ
jgi:hypothetical protein